MNQPIYATFSDPDMAQKAAGALLDHGIRAEHISIIFPEGYVDKDGKAIDEEDFESSAEKGISTTTSQDAATGAAKGAGLGLAAGALAALASVFVPGVGLVLGGGALAIAMGGAVGATAAGAVAGGITGYLKDQGVPEEIVNSYDMTLRRGGATITISPTDEDIDTATIRNLIEKYSGVVSRPVVVETHRSMLI